METYDNFFLLLYRVAHRKNGNDATAIRARVCQTCRFLIIHEWGCRFFECAVLRSYTQIKIKYYNSVRTRRVVYIYTSSPNVVVPAEQITPPCNIYERGVLSGSAACSPHYITCVPRRRTMLRCCVRPTGGRPVATRARARAFSPYSPLSLLYTRGVYYYYYYYYCGARPSFSLILFIFFTFIYLRARRFIYIRI